MRKIGVAFLVAAAVLATGVPAHAWVRGHFWGPRVFIGPLWFPPYPYAYPYPYPYAYAYPPPVVVEPGPQAPAYVQPPQQTPGEESYWYYCERSKSYYPYVSECPEGWLKVAPRPSPPNAALPPAEAPAQPGPSAPPSAPPAPPAPSR